MSIIGGVEPRPHPCHSPPAVCSFPILSIRLWTARPSPSRPTGESCARYRFPTPGVCARACSRVCACVPDGGRAELRSRGSRTPLPASNVKGLALRTRSGKPSPLLMRTSDLVTASAGPIAHVYSPTGCFCAPAKKIRTINKSGALRRMEIGCTRAGKSVVIDFIFAGSVGCEGKRKSLYKRKKMSEAGSASALWRLLANVSHHQRRMGLDEIWIRLLFPSTSSLLPH